MMWCWIDGRTYWPKADPFAPFLTFIGEQEQLKKLSDNFGLENKTKQIAFGQGLLTLTEKVKRIKKIFCKA